MKAVKNKNWEVDNTPEVLQNIHNSNVNISIYERSVLEFQDEIIRLLENNINFSASGDIPQFLNRLLEAFDSRINNKIFNDVKHLLHLFADVTHENNFRVLFATIKNNMCRKFHTDINDLRLLCTYSGPGTLWLTDDNINRKALGSKGQNQTTVLEQERIRQVQAGDVTILKGAIYPNNEIGAVVHRSPTIEEIGSKRLLLRIDTNASQKIWQ